MLEYYHDVRRLLLVPFYFFFFFFFCITPNSNSFPYGQILGQQITDEHLPDVNLIGEMGEVTELGKLVQLVLGCAVSCEKKEGKRPYSGAEAAICKTQHTGLTWSQTT